MPPLEIITIIVAGMAGAMLKDVFKDNSLQMPSMQNGSLHLGCLGGFVLGGVAGFYIDGSPVTAFMAGVSASTIIDGILEKKVSLSPSRIETIEQLIERIAKEENVDPILALAVARAESSFNPKARNINAPDSIDRGLYQWNNKWHPEITDEMADDPETATRLFCKAVKEGHLSWWDNSKPNWSKYLTN